MQEAAQYVLHNTDPVPELHEPEQRPLLSIVKESGESAVKDEVAVEPVVHFDFNEQALYGKLVDHRELRSMAPLDTQVKSLMRSLAEAELANPPDNGQPAYADLLRSDIRALRYSVTEKLLFKSRPGAFRPHEFLTSRNEPLDDVIDNLLAQFEGTQDMLPRMLDEYKTRLFAAAAEREEVGAPPIKAAEHYAAVKTILVTSLWPEDIGKLIGKRIKK